MKKLETAIRLREEGKLKEANEILLFNLGQTSLDGNIKMYKKAIEFYSDKLDEIW